MGIYFGSAPVAPSSMSGSCPNLPLFCLLIVATGPVVCFGMAGSLGSVVLMRETLGRLLLGSWLAVSWSAVRVLILEFFCFLDSA